MPWRAGQCHTFLPYSQAGTTAACKSCPQKLFFAAVRQTQIYKTLKQLAKIQPTALLGSASAIARPQVGSDTQATAAFLRSQQVIGFNTYGEQFNGMHINQTFTGVAIARNRPPVGR